MELIKGSKAVITSNLIFINQDIQIIRNSP